MFRKRTQQKTINLNDQVSMIIEQPTQTTTKQLLADHMRDDVPLTEHKIASACRDTFTMPVEENKTQYLQSLRQDNLLHSKPMDQADKQIMEQQEQTEESVEQLPKLIVVDDAEGEIEILNELQGSDDQQYVDDIIKSSLTRSNYEKVYKSKKQQSSQQSKQKSVLNKITVAGVINRIQKEEAVNQQSLRNLTDDRIRCTEQYGQLSEQLTSKKQKLDQNRARLDNIRKILEYIYQHGDTIKLFERAAILEQAEANKREEIEIEQEEYDGYY